jgi:hypothetical protein
VEKVGVGLLIDVQNVLQVFEVQGVLVELCLSLVAVEGLGVEGAVTERAFSFFVVLHHDEVGVAVGEVDFVLYHKEVALRAESGSSVDASQDVVKGQPLHAGLVEVKRDVFIHIDDALEI